MLQLAPFFNAQEMLPVDLRNFPVGCRLQVGENVEIRRTRLRRLSSPSKQKKFMFFPSRPLGLPTSDIHSSRCQQSFDSLVNVVAVSKTLQAALEIA